ncbi:hypothetical protein ACEZCY_14075 [Streptacidiphilus sp. N1-12]|uniref:Uncharacterized protein n=2 Tax=Streptacidiphilus alkalitolerans TaxID=3342712 RepID=A0ABV6WE82_9ACTN
MSKIRMQCLSEQGAALVVEEGTRPDDQVHTVQQDGDVVVIGYGDIRWPMDVAEWASNNGHATDHEAARVIVAAQTGGDSG